MSKIKLCKKCRSKNNEELFYSGYYNWLNEDCYECPMKDCDGQLIDINLSKNDFDIITSISKDIDFLEAMIKLHDENIIEYELKMSQFKSQLSQTQVRNESNKPKCPTCNSTNIEKISVGKKAVGGFMFGLLSSDVRKSMHCKNCGYKW